MTRDPRRSSSLPARLRGCAVALVVPLLVSTAAGCGSGAGESLASPGVAGAGGSGAGGGGSAGVGGAGSGAGGGGVEDAPVPAFLAVNYVDISKVERISRFRSAIGHDFADSFETCRSMKHYFVPSVPDWLTMEIRSPLDGTIAYIHDRVSYGSQVGIQSSERPEYVVRLFHLHLADGVLAGASVTAGQVLGTHASNDTMSDVAIETDGPDGYRLVSYVLALTDGAFAELEARGVGSREELVISRAERDASPLGCAEDGSFTETGALEDWVDLH